MTVDPRDDEVGRWLRGEAPPAAPDRLREAVRADIAQASQEPASVVRFPRVVRPLLGLAAVAAVILVGIAIVRPASFPSSGGVVATAPAPSASSGPTPGPTPFGRPLSAGPLRSSTFAPAVAFTVPEGWVFAADTAMRLSLSPSDAGSMRQADGVAFWDAVSAYADPAAGSPDGSLAGVPGVGRGAKELATWLAARPQLVTSGPVETTLGGDPAWQVDFRLSPEAGGLCGAPCVNLFDSTDRGRSYQVGYVGDAQVRAILVQVSTDHVVLVAVEDVDGRGFDTLLAQAQPILDSWSFAP